MRTGSHYLYPTLHLHCSNRFFSVQRPATPPIKSLLTKKPPPPPPIVPQPIHLLPSGRAASSRFAVPFFHPYEDEEEEQQKEQKHFINVNPEVTPQTTTSPKTPYTKNQPPKLTKRKRDLGVDVSDTYFPQNNTAATTTSATTTTAAPHVKTQAAPTPPPASAAALGTMPADSLLGNLPALAGLDPKMQALALTQAMVSSFHQLNTKIQELEQECMKLKQEGQQHGQALHVENVKLTAQLEQLSIRLSEKDDQMRLQTDVISVLKQSLALINARPTSGVVSPSDYLNTSTKEEDQESSPESSEQNSPYRSPLLSPSPNVAAPEPEPVVPVEPAATTTASTEEQTTVSADATIKAATK